MNYLVVDDHALIRDAMQAVLLSVDSGASVRTAGTGAQARAALADGPPADLTLLDLQLPDADGLKLLSEFRAAWPAMAVVMLSGSRDAEIVRQALTLGAAGFIPKTEPREVLIRALSLVLAGGVYVPREALGSALPTSAAEGAGGSAADSLRALGLTERQLAVLTLMMRGRTNKHICRELNLAEPTVKNHVTAILRALQVTSRTEAVLAVTRRGWRL